MNINFIFQDSYERGIYSLAEFWRGGEGEFFIAI